MENKNIQEFEALLNMVSREGMDRLIKYVRTSDFYTAPASTRFHSCHEGGLLEHSLNVYHCLQKKKNNPVWKEILGELSEETLILTPLLHDLCKTNMYVTDYKNQKVRSEHGSKVDAGGRYDWETVPFYTVDDKFPYGHGEKSVMMISEFIQLTPIEKYMIRWHMGFSEPKENWNTLGKAIQKYPQILALHEADLESTYLLEEEA